MNANDLHRPTDHQPKKKKTKNAEIFLSATAERSMRKNEKKNRDDSFNVHMFVTFLLILRFIFHGNFYGTILLKNWFDN